MIWNIFRKYAWSIIYVKNGVPLLKKLSYKNAQIGNQLRNSSVPFLWKSAPQNPISQTLTICGAKTNPKTCHFLYVFLLRALYR